jgi:hypothetical protein
MSIDDIHYLKANGTLENFSFLVDSSDRDYISYPHPNEYVISFDSPFKNVVGFEIIDASIPRTMYSIDKYNNSLFIIINTNDSNIDINTNTVLGGSNISFEIEPGDYTFQSMLAILNKMINPYSIEIESISNPPELKNKIKFVSDHSFILDMNKSTSRNVFGFTLMQSCGSIGHRRVEDLKYNSEFNRYYHSSFNKNNMRHEISSSGIIDLIGEKYIILRCPEIEEHLTNNISYSKHNLGLAKFRLGLVGYNEQEVTINKIKAREFHPIGKFSKFTLIFQTALGELYDFKGVEHNIIFNIKYYEIKNDINFTKSLLNPNYTGNILDYKYSIEEQENQSDEEDNKLSTDNFIQNFNENQNLYTK